VEPSLLPRGLKSAQIDAASVPATVGAGHLQLEVVTAVPTGTEGTVGLVGATLGGGFGLLTRSLDMASDWATAYWGTNLDRLRTVKSKYDPRNRFWYQQSIPPAT
jgi:Berberine and berberine like